MAFEGEKLHHSEHIFKEIIYKLIIERYISWLLETVNSNNKLAWILCALTAGNIAQHHYLLNFRIICLILNLSTFWLHVRCVRVICSSVHYSSTLKRDRPSYTLKIRKFILINSITKKTMVFFVCERKNIELFSLFCSEYDNLWDEFNVNATLSFAIACFVKDKM